MTERVDFYVLPGAAPRQRWAFACRLTEKAYLRDMKVVVLSSSAQDAAALDDLLWTFNERAFVPHELCVGRQSAAGAAPVCITADLGAVDGADLLVNLSDALPADIDRFARVAEIVDADDERRRRGRERFKAYRERGLSVEAHQLTDGASA